MNVCVIKQLHTLPRQAHLRLQFQNRTDMDSVEVSGALPPPCALLFQLKAFIGRKIVGQRKLMRLRASLPDKQGNPRQNYFSLRPLK